MERNLEAPERRHAQGGSLELLPTAQLPGLLVSVRGRSCRARCCAQRSWTPGGWGLERVQPDRGRLEGWGRKLAAWAGLG